MAREVLGIAHAAAAGVVSSQVIAEFHNVVTRKLRDLVSREKAAADAAHIADAFEVVPVDRAVVLSAVQAALDFRLNQYDAQIWAAAKAADCTVILTEDTHGEALGGIRYVDPFAPDFDAEAVFGG